MEFGLPAARSPRAAVVTIGNFDGVHIGHQALLARAVDQAKACGGEAIVVTFEPHPRCVLTPEACPSSLTTLEEKRERLESLGIDRLVILEFTSAMSRWSADYFTSELERAFDLSAIVVGHDFALGHGRTGDTVYLRDRGAERGWSVHTVDATTVGGEVVSSSRVRGALVAGDLDQATLLLGGPYLMDSRVEHGDRIGTGLGYPTANLSIGANKCLPGRGVYAMWVRVDDAWHPAAASIGFRPTFGGDHLTVEAFLLDFHGDLYGRRVRAAFVQRLREERMYPDASALAGQIAIDVEQTREITVGGVPQALL